MPIHEPSPGHLAGAWVVFGTDLEDQGLPMGKVGAFLVKSVCPCSALLLGIQFGYKVSKNDIDPVFLSTKIIHLSGHSTTSS